MKQKGKRSKPPHLRDMCKISSIDYIHNSSFNPKKDLNNSKLHLNENGP